jgi:hypothetical protein
MWFSVPSVVDVQLATVALPTRVVRQRRWQITQHTNVEISMIHAVQFLNFTSLTLLFT